LKEEYR